MSKDQAPERKTSEEERFHNDYYSYLELPENATRYAPVVYFLSGAFNKQSFSLLDLGCGNGALSKYLPEQCDYLGVDHSEAAIEQCSKYHNRNFICQDLTVLLPQLAFEHKKFDAIVLSGLLFHSTDKETLEKKDDIEIIQFCLEQLLTDRGYLVIIVPFAYGDHPSHNLFIRAEWLKNSVENMLQTAKAEIVYENLSLQIGLDKKIIQQKVVPDWFVTDSRTDYSNKYAGTYMASWIFFSSPSVS